MSRVLPLLALAAALALAPPAAAYPWESTEEAAFGDPGNRGVVALEALGGRLYAGTERSTGPAQLWATDTGDAGSWRRVSDLRPALPPSTRAVTAFAGARGGPYFLGTEDAAGAAAVYRSADGTTWERAATLRATAVASLAVHHGWVYAGTRDRRGAAIWRAALPAGPFVRVRAFPRRPAVTRAVTALQPFRGALYAGTERPRAGGRLWRLRDGAWRQVRVHDLGRVRPGNVTMGSALAVFQGALHVATRNPAGAELFRTRDTRRWSLQAASGVAGAQRPEIHDFALAFGGLWMTERPGVARVWRAEWDEVFGRGIGFQMTSEDGFGRRTVRDGAPVVAAFRDAVYWGGRDVARGAQLRRLTRATIERLDAPGPGVDFAPGPLRMTASGTIPVTVRCPPAAPRGCHAQLLLRTRRAYVLGGRRGRVLLGAEIYELEPGAAQTIRFRVGRDARALLRRVGRVAVRARAVALGNEPDRVADYVLEARG